MFIITADQERRLIKVEIRGFWQEEVVDRFARELDQAIRRHGFKTGNHALVLGFDAASIAPPAVVEKLRDLTRAAPTRARRVAFHAGSALKRMQIQRIASERSETRVFDNETAAIAWALDPG